ncbi:MULTISPECIES: hypothetical protein [Kandleria]|jgi:hypothetical protein|uniref:Uncharacterized protein n=2 Tax=Kandleria vitulina TaxID=1630 RepID=A0A0R2HMB4_9FIRM|nr:MULTISPECIES: hypothetical protein [Kandleria]KRN50580.1 hypothetical protein IV49_GL001898 [Kandleria vitulina DSM 20405]MBP3276079.1 hypothetical protein [Kandleria sp.]MEE0988397.1 hypothetical protein [Kandleria vitulina]SDL64250.1 hypothetical protein SAMN05216520_1101 [Kandleria vitulina]SDW37144.1 hypothetical protein SAMN04487759_11173 [Kandleria vitulina]
MFSLFYNLAKIINFINASAVIALLVMIIVSLFKPVKLPNYDDIYDYVKRCFMVSLIFMFASWLVVSAQDETSIFKMYSTIAGGFRDMGMFWFVVAITYMITPFVISIAGNGREELRKPFNLFRNHAFIMGAICALISFLLKID